MFRIFLLLCLLLPVNGAIDRTDPLLIPSVSHRQKSSELCSLHSLRLQLPQEKELLGNYWEVMRPEITKTVEHICQSNGIQLSKKAPLSLVLRFGMTKAPRNAIDSYLLSINNSEGIVITAPSAKGLFYGLQTLRQLIVAPNEEGAPQMPCATVPTCKILDYPAFAIRGFMQDVGRNYQPIALLKEHIELMARYKMNVFHWHLSDYHGWRLESKRFPQLSHPSTMERDKGKFYTQEAFIDLQHFCAARGITLIPELDSPGHSTAFRKALGIPNMRDPRALQSMIELLEELVELAPASTMPFIHLGTDEVRRPEEQVNRDYLPALHKMLLRNQRTIIGWWHGLCLPDKKHQIFQTWAQHNPPKNAPHIDSRANYLNHLEALDFGSRMFFQQPCRQPFGNDKQLGGILALWPDVRVEKKEKIYTNNPVFPATVAYADAVWAGRKNNYKEFWAKLPQPKNPLFKDYAAFEERIAQHRNRFMSHIPFPFVKTYPIEWKLLGPVRDGEIVALENAQLADIYQTEKGIYRWTKPLRGGAIHIRHFFGFDAHLSYFPSGKNVVWAATKIWSPHKQTIKAWLSFNTSSSSDNRAGACVTGQWNANALCKVFINGQELAPPHWKQPGQSGIETPFDDEIYTSRPPIALPLQKGWNTLLLKTSPHWKWSFSFSPIQVTPQGIREIDDLRYSTDFKSL